MKKKYCHQDTSSNYNVFCTIPGAKTKSVKLNLRFYENNL